MKEEKKYTSMRSGKFEIKSDDIPNEILNNIISYKLDTVKKRFSIEIYLYTELLSLLNNIKTNKIEIIHKNNIGNILLKRMVYDLIPYRYSSKGSYINKDDLMTTTLTWSYQELYDDPS